MTDWLTTLYQSAGPLPLAAAVAALNRGRGSHFWDTIDSTTASRVLAAIGMAAAAAAYSDHPLYAFLWAFPTLLLWSVFAWDNYWAAAIGHAFDPEKRTFPPVDWLMTHAPGFRRVYDGTSRKITDRLWGATAMGLRQSLAGVTLAGLAALNGGNPAHALGPLLFGFVYVLCGYWCKPYAIGWAEYVVGGLLGTLIWLMSHA